MLSAQPSETNVAILIPAFEPDETLLKLISDLNILLDESLGLAAKIIVIDDGSKTPIAKDVFKTLTRQNRIVLLAHGINKGKGAALKTGLAKSVTLNAKTVVTADAGGQHLPEDIMRVMKASEETQRYALGTRAFDTNVPFRSRFGNDLTHRLFRLVSHQPIKDTQSGLRAFPASYISLSPDLNLCHRR